MAQYRSLLILSNDEREELTRWSQSRTLAAGDAFRARLILALANGLSYREIEEKLNTSAPTIARWRGRFKQNRIDGLNPRHKGSRPRVVTPSVDASVLTKSPGQLTSYWDSDVGLLKNIPLSDRFNMTLRAEAFNAPNHTNFGVPGNTYTSTGSFGIIQTAQSPRVIQLSGRLTF